METMSQIAKNIRLHGENLRDFQLYHDADKALKNQFIEVTLRTSPQELKDPILGLGQVTCLKILTHLRKTYDKITQSKMEKKNSIAKVWIPPTHINNLFEQLLVGQEIGNGRR